ncbi:MAG: ATP-binding protein, partial [Sphingomonadales bacterium]
GVAHEFNNLLMVILGNIETIESRLKEDDPLRPFAASALKGALRGAELTESLLAFSRKQRLEAGQADLNGLVGGMQSLYQRTLGESISIETNLAENLWLTSADAGQIEAALLNFVLNARDAMPNGGTISVRTSNVEIGADRAARIEGVEAGDFVALEVSDTGTGMSENEIEHAFEPFFTTKEVGKGAGLGLSVAFGFAKQSSGCLEIESELSHGTTVRLSLPRAPETEPRTEPETEAPLEPASGNGRILVLEDDAEVRQLVSTQLTKLGYKVFEAADGPAALRTLDDHPEIDLMFSDVVLPGGMSGPEAVAAAKKNGHAGLKVLFTSGYPEKDVERLRVGDRDIPVLAKPYQRLELAAAIATAIHPS